MAIRQGRLAHPTPEIEAPAVIHGLHKPPFVLARTIFHSSAAIHAAEEAAVNLP
jgi:hypothetical protein